MKKLIFFFILSMGFSPLFAQMWNGTDTLYGNEWINYDQSYYRILIAEDGVYRISYETLVNQGIPANTIEGNQFQLFHNGKEVPLYRSNQNQQTAGDYLEFCGKQNRSEMDQFLFQNPDDMLNPFYSMYTDSSAYFLTWSTTTEGQSFTPTNNELTNLPPKEEWFWYNETLEFHSHPIHKTNFDGVAESIYDTGEGYAKSYSNNNDISLNPKFVANTSENSTFSIRLVSSHGFTHELEIDRNGETIITENWSGTQLKQYTHQVPSNELNDTEELNIRGGTASNDRYAIAVAQIRHPRMFDFDNASYFSFELSSSNADQYVEINNFNTSGGTPILYDLTNNLRLEAVLEGDLLKFKLPSSSDTRALILVAPNQITSVNLLEDISFTNFEALSSDYIILSHPKLFAGNNPVQAYAEYRASAAGGNFDPMIVDVEQLYLQFGYGINRHPQGIRNFAQYIQKNWTVPPRYFFIIGKGREYDQIRSNAQLSSDATASFAVPTFGRPGADNLLLATHENSAPIFALGRLAATTLSDVQLYLEKVKGYEQLQQSTAEADRAWRKEIIHLGGGTSPGEQNSIKAQLDQMKNIIENNTFGGNVFTFTKTSTDPIQQSQSELLTQKINDGVSIITFFGHAGTGGFDFSIDDPSTYENRDKYPVLISLGCLSGQLHGNIKSIGERFLFQEEKGAIIFLATTGFGYISPLANMQKVFYDYLGDEGYGLSVGEILQRALQVNAPLIGLASASLNQQFTLAGDPAIRVLDYPAPDYTIPTNKLSLEPSIISSQLDSFSIQFEVDNIGRANVDSLEIQIERELPNGAKIIVKSIEVEAPKYKKTYQFQLPVLREEGVGFNRLFIAVDPSNKVDEFPVDIAENNNKFRNALGQLGLSFFVYANGVEAIFPPEYAIVGDSNIVLKATTANVFSPLQSYYFELDTVISFNSSYLKTYEIAQTGGLLKWPLNNITLEENRVYFWRVGTDSPNGIVWDQKSFIYRSGQIFGWNQSHKDQLVENNFFDLQIEDSSKELNFLQDFKDIGLKTGIYPDIRPEISINNTPYRYIPWDSPTRGGVQIAVLDSISGIPWLNIPIGSGQSVGQYGSNIPSWVVDYALFPYTTRNQEGRLLAMDFLNNVVPSGNYVIFMTVQETNSSYEPEEWAIDSTINNDINLFNLLEAQGANQIRNTLSTGAIPYFFVYKKDDPTFEPIEGFGSLNDVFSASFGIAGTWDNGHVESERVGPAKEWQSLNWELSNYESSSDEIKIEVWGINRDSTTEKITEILNTPSGTYDLSAISTNETPYLELKYFVQDTINRTPPDISFWRVEYTGIPELSINPNAHYYQNLDTIQQGDLLKVSLAIENIGHSISEPTTTRLNLLENLDFEILPVSIQSITTEDSTHLNFQIDTRTLVGKQSLEVQINPEPNFEEYNYNNNVGLLSFTVIKDNKNPTLDVTFDGNHVMNGDIVSANPFIQISLKDENDFFPLNDTSLFNVLLKYPNELEHRRLDFRSNAFLFEQGNASNNNRAKVSFSPIFEEDGIYELIVQAEDASGNQSGRYDYKLQFEVITDAQISNIFNYPNPFSTSTQFVYTLTGSVPPEEVVIQIMTVSGRVVKEITEEELGPLKIGTHRTEYAWDGTDEYGDRLANGVYLYRVLAKDIDGNLLEKYDNNTDKFFRNNLGKMVILR